MTDDRLPWFHCYPEKWLAALAEMKPDQGYVYWIICLRIYEKRGPIPDSTEALARRIGYRPSHIQRIVETLCALGKLIRTPDGRLTNPFSEQEILSGAQIASRTRTIRTHAANISWQKRKQNQHNGHAHAMQNGTQLDIDSETEIKEEGKEPSLALTGGDSTPSDGWPSHAWEQFWGKYLHKVGKADAKKAFDRVRRARIVTWAELEAGLDRYLAKTDDRPWCNPSTWLNQHRWADQPAQVVSTRARSGGGFAAVARRLGQSERNQGGER
jgi:hypothetical protein